MAIVVSIVLINLVMICFGAGNITGNHKCITVRPAFLLDPSNPLRKDCRSLPTFLFNAKAAGAFLIAVSFNLWYIGLALLLLESRNPLAKFFPLGSLAPKS